MDSLAYQPLDHRESQFLTIENVSFLFALVRPKKQ